MDLYWIIDAVAIIILVIYTLVGFAKGFLHTLISLFGNLASLTVAIIVCKPFANLLNSMFGVANWLGGLLASQIGPILPQFDVSTTGETIITQLNAGGFLAKILARFVDATASYANTAELLLTVQNAVGGILTLILSAIILFILIRIAVLLLSKLFDAISKSHAFGGLDRLLGGVLGLAKGVVFVGVVLVLVFAVCQIPLVGDFLNGYIEGTTVVKWGYGYIIQFMDWLMTKIDIGAIINSIL